MMILRLLLGLLFFHLLDVVVALVNAAYHHHDHGHCAENAAKPPCMFLSCGDAYDSMVRLTGFSAIKGGSGSHSVGAYFVEEVDDVDDDGDGCFCACAC